MDLTRQTAAWQTGGQLRVNVAIMRALVSLRETLVSWNASFTPQPLLSAPPQRGCVVHLRQP